MGVNKTLPQNGNLNFVGYSWGANIAAQSALYHAAKGTEVDNLVLIGAPMNNSLKEAVLRNPLINKVNFIELGNQGDPIYSGMGDNEIVSSAPTLGRQMQEGEGHFHYSREDDVGIARRRELAARLYSYGVR